MKKEILESDELFERLIVDAQANDDSIENLIIKNSKINNIEIYNLDFSKVEFEEIEFSEIKSDRMSFTDCEFKNCNLSNTVFDNTSFVRCKFKNCKLTGDMFTSSRFYNVEFNEVSGNFSNFTMSILENVKYKKSVFRNSYFQECKVKKLEFLEKPFSMLVEYKILKTKLDNIDFSSSIISGIVVYVEDLKGAIINEMQAIELVGLLGVKIAKD